MANEKESQIKSKKVGKKTPSKEETEEVNKPQIKEKTTRVEKIPKTPPEGATRVEKMLKTLPEEVEEKDDPRTTLEEVENKYLRLAAEFENYRRRTQREQLASLQTATISLVTPLLSVLGDLERAEESTRNDNITLNNLQEGLGLVLQNFKQKLQNFGFKEISVSKGDTFDADLHEAIAQVPAPTPALSGKVLNVIEKGYRLHDKVVRYTKVQTATHE